MGWRIFEVQGYQSWRSRVVIDTLHPFVDPDLVVEKFFEKEVETEDGDWGTSAHLSWVWKKLMRSRFESSLDPFIFWIVFFGYCCTKCTLFTLSGITFVKIIGTLHIVKGLLLILKTISIPEWFFLFFYVFIGHRFQLSIKNAYAYEMIFFVLTLLWMGWEYTLKK